MKNSLAEKSETRVARPPKVLVPLIKQDLRDAKEAADQAGLPYYIAAGEKLIEAKAGVAVMDWLDWLKRNFHLSRFTAAAYMRAARNVERGATFATLSEAHGDMRPTHPTPWKERVQEVLNRVDLESFNLQARDISLAKDRKLERELALQLIDIGYKVLAVKMHPDKSNGSHEAMRRLNKVRARLKEAA